MKVLITGAAGPRGLILRARLSQEGHEAVGVDTEAAPPSAGVHKLDYRKRGFEDLLRRERFDAICHLALHAGFRLPTGERHKLNLEGTQRVITLAAAHGVAKVVVASHAMIYGALPDNPYFMTEDAPPRVGQDLPEMQDVVTADLMAGAAMSKHPQLSLVVLRTVNCLGPTSRDALAQLLRHRRVPTILGYDPMVQVIHEADQAKAFACALAPGVRGVFNVTGAGEVPISVLVREAGGTKVPLPETLVQVLLGRFGFPDAGGGVVEFLKNPCLVDGARFAAATGFAPEHDLVATVRSVRAPSLP